MARQPLPAGRPRLLRHVPSLLIQRTVEPVNDSLSEELRCTLFSITARLVAFIGDEIAANCAPALTKGAARAHERPSWPLFDPCFRRRADGAGVCSCRLGVPAFQQFFRVLFCKER